MSHATGHGTATGRIYGPARPSEAQGETWQAAGREAGRKKTRWNQQTTGQDGPHTPAVDQHGRHYSDGNSLHSPIGDARTAAQNGTKPFGRVKGPKYGSGPHPQGNNREPGEKKARRTPWTQGGARKTLLDRLREDFDAHWRHMHNDVAARLACECRKQRRNYLKQVRTGNQSNSTEEETHKDKPIDINVQLNETLRILRDAGLGNLADSSNVDGNSRYYTSQG